MPTLWEILTGKKKPKVPVESLFYNPLEIRIGNSVKISTVDLESLNFQIQQLREVKRTIGSQEFFFADYDVLARPFDGDPVAKRLRLVPLENPDGELTHKVLVLDKVSECGYDEDFYQGLAFEKSEGEFREGEDTFWRIDDVKTEWKAKTATLSDLDQNGKVDKNEVRYGELTYWDFWRETEGDWFSKVLEFYIVEMDDNGYFEFWRGQEIDPVRVLVS